MSVRSTPSRSETSRRRRHPPLPEGGGVFFCTIEIMPTVKHKLLSKNLSKGTGVCAHCGAVPLGWKQSAKGASPRCSIGLQESKNSPNRNTHRSRTLVSHGWGTLRRKHGLTVDEARLFREGKSCEVCGSTERLCVDHCHRSGKIRGILCDRCNRGLGYFRDSVKLLAMATVYLSDSRDGGTIQGPLVSSEGEIRV